MTDDKRADLLAVHLKRLDDMHGSFKINISFVTAVSLIGQLQLALRHPGNRGHGAVLTRQVVKDMIAAMEASSPGIAPLLNLGFDPSQDV